MASSEEDGCHLCECSLHFKEYEREVYSLRQCVEKKNVESLKILLDSSQWYKINVPCNSPLSPTAIFDSTCNFHSNLLNILHYAFDDCRYSIEVARHLIERGLDINRQRQHDLETPLHICCKIKFVYHLVEKAIEGISMLLWYGADPMIQNRECYTAFDVFMGFYYPNVLEGVAYENLFCCTFDRYTESILAEPFFKALRKLDLRVFDEISKGIPKVVFIDKFRHVDVLLMMEPQRLRFVVENLDYLVKELLDKPKNFLNLHLHTNVPLLIENFNILLNSKSQLEFTNWLLYTVNIFNMESVVHCYREPSVIQELLYLLLSYGMKLRESEMDLLYYKCGGYSEMFKTLLHMELLDYSGEQNYYGDRYTVMPTILYDISLDVPKMIKKRVFSKENLRELAPYFTIPSDLLLDNDCAGIQTGPRVPLLLEIARNVFRKYIIERLGITNAGQFYAFIKMLPFTSYLKAVITLERKLY